MPRAVTATGAQVLQGPSGIAGPALFSGGQTGEQQAPTPLFRVPLDGSPVDSIGAVSGSEILVQASGGLCRSCRFTSGGQASSARETR